MGMDSQFIQDLRKDIDDMDTQILQLLGRRMRHAAAIGNYKKEHDLPVIQGDRWNAILQEAVVKGKKEGLTPIFIEKIWNAIHDESVRIQEGFVK
ncbi:chorismate mutase [Maribacter sp. CXY002]|uniref:chorismate mutase n=1 Tax=Maribacter luteocoastalis TaxID=3407671 RepID=UPI003B6741C4